MHPRRALAETQSDTVVYARTVTAAGKDTSAGTRTVVSHIVVAPNGERLLEVVQRFPGGGGEIIDTAIADASTLSAVAHRSHQPSKTMRFDFVNGSAHGTVTSLRGADSSVVRDVDQALGGPIFDSNIIELVVASQPLAPGFTTEVPFFIYERGGRVPMSVRVLDRATVEFPRLGRRDAWIVNVAVPGAPATVWVDALTRAVLRVRYDIASRNMSFTDDRVTPLRG